MKMLFAVQEAPLILVASLIGWFGRSSGWFSGCSHISFCVGVAGLLILWVLCTFVTIYSSQYKLCFTAAAEHFSGNLVWATGLGAGASLVWLV